MMRARKSIPTAVPRTFFCSTHNENAFNREILVMKRALGVPLNNKDFNDDVFNALVAILKQLHSTQVNTNSTPTYITRIVSCRKSMIRFLNEQEIIPKQRLLNHLSALQEYYIQNQEAFYRQHTIVHGDLWWDNILIDNGNVTIVDWLDSDKQDYCRDLAQLKIGTLNELLNPIESHTYFKKLLKIYQTTFNDDMIVERMRFHLPLMYLEEAFYLPFTFFPWEMKYQENKTEFKNRFLDHYDRSERSFVNVLAN
jgi:aminoglycoside phosphotransferase